MVKKKKSVAQKKVVKVSKAYSSMTVKKKKTK